VSTQPEPAGELRSARARAPLVLTLAGLAVLFAAGFVRVPMPLGLAAILAATVGAAWSAFVLKRWQPGLAAGWMAASLARDLFQHRPIPEGGTGTLVTLIAFAILVLGGWWVGRLSENGRG
jgi:hypothetical protein